MDGATGVLRIGADGNVMRAPAWSTFRDGVAVPLAGAGAQGAGGGTVVVEPTPVEKAPSAP